MSVTDAVQVAMVQALRADAALAALVGDRVYDRVPTGAAHPYVSLGPEDWPQRHGACMALLEGVVQIDVWSRDVGRREAKRIVDRIVEIFDGADLALAAPYRGLGTEIAMRGRIMEDRDGLTIHGVVQIAVMAEAAV